MGISKPTFKVILDERRSKGDDKYPLKLRVTYNRIRKYYNVGKDLTKDQFLKLLTSKLDTLKDIKIEIKALEMKAENISKRLDEFSFYQFEQIFLAKSVEVKPKDVYSYISQYIELLTSENRISTASSYGCTMSSLKSFKAHLTFEEITPTFLKAYERYMVDGGRSTTTVGIYLRSLRTIYNQAIENGIVNKDLYPFKKSKFQIPAGRNVKKALTIKELEQIFNYNSQPMSSEDKARDIWVFSYLCNGLNIKDICRLRYKNIDSDRIIFVRAKTQLTTKSDQIPIVIYLTDKAKEIIEKWKQPPISASTYLFPFLPEDVTPVRERDLVQYLTKFVNKYMDRIGQNLGILKPITSYSARHSYSTVLKRSGAPIEFISESLGHSSVQTTRSYLDSFEDDVKKQYATLLTNFNSKKD